MNDEKSIPYKKQCFVSCHRGKSRLIHYSSARTAYGGRGTSLGKPFFGLHEQGFFVREKRNVQLAAFVTGHFTWKSVAWLAEASIATKRITMDDLLLVIFKVPIPVINEIMMSREKRCIIDSARTDFEWDLNATRCHVRSGRTMMACCA